MGTYSIYEINENSTLLNEMRLKFMTIYSASSYAAPLCLVVSGLDENELIMTNEELKESKCIFVLKVEGFSMHSGVDPIIKQPGYIIFIRSSKDKEDNIDKTRYDYYNDTIFYSFAESIRKLNYREWSEGYDTTPDMTVVGWCDREIDQVANILSEKVNAKDKSKKNSVNET